VQVDKLTALGVLVAGVAHEVNSPNQVILTNASLLVRSCPPLLSVLGESARDNHGFLFGGLEASEFGAALPRMLAEIQKCAERIDGIIRGLKGFSREDPGASRENLEIAAVVKSAVDLVASHLRRATERFSVTVEENLPAVRGNAQRLEQVIVNLLLNACQAVTDRRRAIAVMGRLADGRAGVMVEVRDEGVGIPPDDLCRLAEPFFTTRRDAGGTGLGLYISRKIVEEHGGTLRIESTAGSGTRAILTLPAERHP
jgi:polar amino acid transport system substrate-binding protein